MLVKTQMDIEKKKKKLRLKKNLADRENDFSTRGKDGKGFTY